MAGHGSFVAATAGTIIAAGMGGALTEVFNELALTLAIMGFVGGITCGLVNFYPWRGVVRSGAVGGLLAVGFGALSPAIIGKLFGISVGSETMAVTMLAGSSFALGFGQEIVVRYFRVKESGNEK